MYSLAHLYHQANHAPIHRERFLIAFLATTWTTWERDRTPELERTLRAELERLHLQSWGEAALWHTRFFGVGFQESVLEHTLDRVLDEVLDEMEEEILHFEADR